MDMPRKNGEVATVEDNGLTDEIREKVLVGGDLTDLTPRQRLLVYEWRCKADNVDPITRPFDYMRVPDQDRPGQKKLILYNNKTWAAQKRSEFQIKLDLVSKGVEDGLYEVIFHGTNNRGQDEIEIGAVPYEPSWKADFRANLKKKAWTQAKRRLTIALSGRGDLDESEADIPGAERVNVDPQTGEITGTAPKDEVVKKVEEKIKSDLEHEHAKAVHEERGWAYDEGEKGDFDDTVPFKVPKDASEDVKAIIKDLYRCTTKQKWLDYGQKLKKNEAILADMFPPDVKLIRDAYAARGKDFGINVKPRNGI
jgi:hypothetical protein